MIKNTNKDEITNRNVVFAEVSQIIDDPRRWALDDFFIFVGLAVLERWSTKREIEVDGDDILFVITNLLKLCPIKIKN